LPPLVSGAPLIVFGGEVVAPAPILSRVAAGTEVVVVTRLASAWPPGAAEPLALPLPPVVEFPPARTSPRTIPTTATMAPPAIRIRFLVRVRCADARCAAIRARLSEP
jgi:hypothetical protein